MRLASRRPRRGFTLIEVTLVMAILVIIGSLAIPYLFGSFARGQLRNGGDLMRAALTQARLSAMETGQVQVFRCELKGRRFQVGSLVDLAAAGDSKTASATAPALPAATDDEDPHSTKFDLRQLPNGVTFVSGEFAPSPQLIAMLGSAEMQGWSNPIVFLPDGTSTDATMLLANENDHTLRITLRGLTGAIRVGELDNEAMPK